MKLENTDIKDFLEAKVSQYNHPRFIDTDPIQVPHLYSRKEDIEISGFLTATIAWGNRKSIIANAKRLMQLMGNAPFDFVMDYKKSNEAIDRFVHRTFNGTDLDCFFRALQHIYKNHGGLENALSPKNHNNVQSQISDFKRVFFEVDHQYRSQKHISDPLRGSAAKRINMFLRWMVRNDNAGVDFGIWKILQPSQLSCPLDVHSGNVARKLGLLHRQQNDAKALYELDCTLRQLEPNDPAKYDFALFGLGVFEGF